MSLSTLDTQGCDGDLSYHILPLSDTAVAGNTSDVAGGFSTNGDEHHLPLPVVAVTSVPENRSTSSDKHIGVDRSMDQDSMRAPLVSSREA